MQFRYGGTKRRISEGWGEQACFPFFLLLMLGEEIMPSVLHIRARGLPSLKSKITEFLRIQIRVHHPGEILLSSFCQFQSETFLSILLVTLLIYFFLMEGGRILEDDGAWFRDEDQWQSSIRIMYEQVIDEYSSGAITTSRLRRSSALV